MDELKVKGKWISELDRSAPAAEMIQLALATQLKAMCALREKALDRTDPEGVHDMRVLSRRLRSAIADFEPFLRKPRLPIVKLRNIARSLGEVRDEDVALKAIVRLKPSASGLALEGIELLERERRQRLEKDFDSLDKLLNASTISELAEEFLSALSEIAIKSPRATKLQTGATVLAYGELAASVILNRLQDFRAAAAKTIYSPAATSELHELRILAKRLRYAVELSAPCWGKVMKKIAKEIALMQTSLGELHDCDVWIEELGERLRQPAKTNESVGEKTQEHAGAIWLLSQFTVERSEHYLDALNRWEEWEADGFLTNLEQIIADAR